MIVDALQPRARRRGPTEADLDPAASRSCAGRAAARHGAGRSPSRSRRPGPADSDPTLRVRLGEARRAGSAPQPRFRKRASAYGRAVRGVAAESGSRCRPDRHRSLPTSAGSLRSTAGRRRQVRRSATPRMSPHRQSCARPGVPPMTRAPRPHAAAVRKGDARPRPQRPSHAGASRRRSGHGERRRPSGPIPALSSNGTGNRHKGVHGSSSVAARESRSGLSWPWATVSGSVNA